MAHQNLSELICCLNEAAEALLACEEENKDAFLRACNAYGMALSFPESGDSEQSVELMQARLKLADAQYRYAVRMQSAAPSRTK